MKNKQFAFWKANIVYLLLNYSTYRKLKKNFDRNVFENYVNGYIEYVLKNIDVSCEIIGEDKISEDGIFFVSNHGSMFDSYFTYLAIKRKHSYFIAGDMDYSTKIPMIRNFMKWSNSIFVDRSSLKAGLKAIKAGEEHLLNGNNLCIFPEGEVTSIITNDKKLLGDFHFGSFKAAKNAKVPVVPLTVVGSDKIHKTNSYFSPITSGNVKVIIGDPIYDFLTDDNMNTKDMANKAHNIILKTLEENK